MVSSEFSSVVSSSCGALESVTTLLSSDTFITRTPFDVLEQILIEFASILIITPSLEIKIISSSRSTDLIAATLPYLSVL